MGMVIAHEYIFQAWLQQTINQFNDSLFSHLHWDPKANNTARLDVQTNIHEQFHAQNSLSHGPSRPRILIHKSPLFSIYAIIPCP